MIYVSNDEGQVYAVDISVKNTLDNAAAQRYVNLFTES